MNAKRNVLTIAISIMCSFVLSTSLHAESIFLTDGSIVEGKIVNETDDALSLSLPNELRMEIPKTKVLRIITSDDYKARVEVRKKDGSVVPVFIVDQDAASYTARSELGSPKEFKIFKSDVKEILKNGKPISLESVTSVKLAPSPRRAALISINPLRSGSFLVGYNAPGIGFSIVKSVSFVVPLALILASAFTPSQSDQSVGDDSSSNYDVSQDENIRNLALVSLGVWVLSTAGDMVFSYYHVEELQRAAGKGCRRGKRGGFLCLAAGGHAGPRRPFGRGLF